MIIPVIEVHVLLCAIFAILSLIFHAELLILYGVVDHDSAPFALRGGDDLLDQSKWTCSV